MNDETAKPKRFRSPPYPMFDLSKAVERAAELHRKASSHAVGVNVLAAAWGMKSTDGRVWRIAASLIQYGLLTDSGTGKTRKFQITDSAKRIALDATPDSPRRREAIQNAALSPMIHRELWDQYGDPNLLSDAILHTHLTIEREEAGEAPYSPSAAEEVVATYRSTLAFADLGGSGMVTSDVSDTAEEVNNDGPSTRSVPAREQVVRRNLSAQDEGLAMGVHERVLTSGLLSKQATFRVVVSGPVGEAEIERLLKKLEMDKEIMADSEPSGAEPESGPDV